MKKVRVGAGLVLTTALIVSAAPAQAVTDLPGVLDTLATEVEKVDTAEQDRLDAAASKLEDAKKKRDEAKAKRDETRADRAEFKSEMAEYRGEVKVLRQERRELREALKQARAVAIKSVAAALAQEVGNPDLAEVTTLKELKPFVTNGDVTREQVKEAREALRNDPAVLEAREALKQHQADMKELKKAIAQVKEDFKAAR